MLQLSGFLLRLKLRSERSEKGGANLKNKLFGFIYAMNYIAQAAWSFIFSGGLVFGIGYFLWWRFSLGKGVLVASVLLGVLAGVYSMFRYIIRMASFAGGEADGRRRRRKNTDKK